MARRQRLQSLQPYALPQAFWTGSAGQRGAPNRAPPLIVRLGQRGADRRTDLLTAIAIPAVGDHLGGLHERNPEFIEPGDDANEAEESCIGVDEASRVPDQSRELEDGCRADHRSRAVVPLRRLERERERLAGVG